MPTLCDPNEDPFRYACQDEQGGVVGEQPFTDADGKYLAQGPVKFCGTDRWVCEGDKVSGCISDTDGAPTSYGPAPAAPDPANANGTSPLMSRVRIDRPGEPPLPYSDEHHPDQLLDIVDSDGNPIAYDGGTFVLPEVVIPEPPTIPEGIKIRRGNFNFAPLFAPAAGTWPVVPSLGNIVTNTGAAGIVTNPSSVNKALLVVDGQSDAIVSWDEPVPAINTGWGVELVLSIDGGTTWNKIHENGFNIEDPDTRVGPFSKSVQATFVINAAAVVTLTYGVRVTNYGAGPDPAKGGLKIANFSWFLHTGHDVADV